MRFLLAAILCLLGAKAGAQQSTLGSGAVGTNVTFLTPSSGDIGTIIGTSPPAGRFYLLAPGTYYVSNWFSCPTNGGVIGQGRNSTVLIDCFTNAIPTPLIAGADNGYIAFLTITNIERDRLTGIPASCIGTHQNQSAAYQGMVIEGCNLFGGSDTYYVRHTNNTSQTFMDCNLDCQWDVVVAFNSGTHSFKFYNCNFTNIANTAHGNNYDIFTANNTTVARAEFYNCILVASNGISANGPYFFHDGTGANNSGLFVNCFTTNLTASNLKTSDWSSDSGNITFYNTIYDQTRYGDDVSGSPTTKYWPLNVNLIQFKGDAGHGAGPTITTTFPTNSSTDIRFSAGITATALGGTTVAGTDQAGTALTLNGGAGTGTGRGGALALQTSPALTTGTTVQTLQTRHYISAKEVTLTESSATLVFNVSVASGKSVAIRVLASTRADNGTDFQETTDTFVVAAVNKAGTVTPAISASAPAASAVSSGTLATTWTAAGNGNGVDIKCSAVSSLTQTTLVTQWRAEIDSNGTPTVTPQ